MLHDLFFVLLSRLSGPRHLKPGHSRPTLSVLRLRIPSLAVTTLMLGLTVLACTPVHKGKVRQGISGVNNGNVSVVRDSFSNADIDGSGFLERREFPAFKQGPEISRLLQQISDYNKSGALLFDDVDENTDNRIGVEEMLSTINSLVL